MKTLEERKQDFCYWAACELIDKPVQIVLDFQEYWTEHSPNGKKMRFEKEKVFDMKRRFATWQKNAKIWDKTPKSTIDKHIESHNEALEILNNKTK